MTGFHDVSFPLAIGWAARGGPERRTEIVTLRSGHEERNAVWANSRRRWDVAPGVRTRADLELLAAFFEARNGRLHAFRFLDPFDHSSASVNQAPTPSDQQIGVGDGLQTDFPLIKHYGDSAAIWSRPITHPIMASVRVAVNGIEIPVQVRTGGAVIFDQPPEMDALVSAGFRFETPARFDSDQLEWSLEGAAGLVTSVPLIEVRGQTLGGQGAGSDV